MLHGILHRRTVRAVLFASVIGLGGSSGLADPIVKVGDPPKAGKVDIKITKKDGTTKTETIDITRPDNMTADERKMNKAEEIANQLSQLDYNASVNSNGHVDISADKVEMGKNTTGEVDTVVAFGGIGLGNSAVCSWAGDVGPVGITGSTVYEASIGWDGFEVATIFGHNELASSTIDALLSRVYTGLNVNLPPELQANLQLDLGNDRITFDFPSYAASPFISAGNSSECSWAVFTVNTPVPEPTGAALLLSGAAAIVRRRRVA